MNKLLEQLYRTYGGAAADTAGGFADIASAVPNAMLGYAQHYGLNPKGFQFPTGVMQHSVPQPSDTVNKVVRFVAPFLAPGPTLVKQNPLLKSAELARRSSRVVKSATMSKPRYELSPFAKGKLVEMLKDPLLRDHPHPGVPPPEKTVNPKELLGTQDHVYRGKNFRRPKDHDEDEPFADLPLVARTPDGKMHILDGHHRIDKAIGSGDKGITARVYDVHGSELPDNMGQVAAQEAGPVDPSRRKLLLGAAALPAAVIPARMPGLADNLAPLAKGAEAKVALAVEKLAPHFAHEKAVRAWAEAVDVLSGHQMQISDSLSGMDKIDAITKANENLPQHYLDLVEAAKKATKEAAEHGGEDWGIGMADDADIAERPWDMLEPHIQQAADLRKASGPYKKSPVSGGAIETALDMYRDDPDQLIETLADTADNLEVNFRLPKSEADIIKLMDKLERKAAKLDNAGLFDEMFGGNHPHPAIEGNHPRGDEPFHFDHNPLPAPRIPDEMAPSPPKVSPTDIPPDKGRRNLLLGAGAGAAATVIGAKAVEKLVTKLAPATETAIVKAAPVLETAAAKLATPSAAQLFDNVLNHAEKAYTFTKLPDGGTLWTPNPNFKPPPPRIPDEMAVVPVAATAKAANFNMSAADKAAAHAEIDDIIPRATKLLEQARAKGKFQHPIGATLHTPESMASGKPPYKVLDHWVSAEDPRRYGYYVSQSGLEDSTINIGRGGIKPDSIQLFGGPKPLPHTPDEMAVVPVAVAAKVVPQPFKSLEDFASTGPKVGAKRLTYPVGEPLEDGVQQHAFQYRHTEGGKPITGDINIDEDGLAQIDLWGEEVNKLGPATIRQLIGRIKAEIPGIREFEGWRTTGARGGGKTMQRLDVSRIPPRYPEEMPNEIYHGGAELNPDRPGVTYFTPDRKAAETYVQMHNDRFGKTGRVTAAEANIQKPASRDEIMSTIQELGFKDMANDMEYYTPASAFDVNLHDPEDVKGLVDALKKKGFDGAILDDIPYDDAHDPLNASNAPMVAHIPFGKWRVKP